MKMIEPRRLRKLWGLLATGRPEPAEQADRIVTVQRDVMLPAKAGLCVVVLYYLFSSGWLPDEETAPSVALEFLRRFFEVYILCNLVGAILFIIWRRLPPELIQWLAFTLGLLDGIFMAGLTVVTGGFSSIVFWVFPGLIVLHALCIPLAMPQIVLNLLLSIFYMGAVLLTPQLGWENTLPVEQLLANMSAAAEAAAGVSGPGAAGTHNPNTNQLHNLARINKELRRSNSNPGDPVETVSTDELLQRVSLLWLLAFCCYGLQVLLERQSQAFREAAEFAAREGQLHSAGRLAAEFAHRMKNPLAIINNAAYSLQRSLRENKNSAAQQIEIIQEEVARADKVITQIMGYAQLSEGRVEKLKVVEEIERACREVFPPAVPTGIKLKKRWSGPFPVLLMQRGHFSEILTNLLLNARQALNDQGTVSVAARCSASEAVEISVADDGPGIPPEKVERIFEAYFTTKEKGTGLGLAIVKHNAELYGGRVQVESVLGKGAKFTVTLPAISQPKPFVR